MFVFVSVDSKAKANKKSVEVKFAGAAISYILEAKKSLLNISKLVLVQHAQRQHTASHQEPSVEEKKQQEEEEEEEEEVEKKNEDEAEVAEEEEKEEVEEEQAGEEQSEQDAEQQSAQNE